jgi:uncharacterized protein
MTNDHENRIAITSQPIQVHERIDLLDILRGLALFGILVVNMRDFNFPTEYCEPRLFWTAPIDQITEIIIAFFFSEKFYSLFSLLFGIGFGLQMERLATKHLHAEFVYGRRLFILLIIGLGHGIFIWWGDVLAVYAILGFVLLFFRPLPSKWLVLIAVLFLVIPIGISTVKLTLAKMAQEKFVQNQKQAIIETNSDEEKLKGATSLIELYSKGSYVQIMKHRVIQLKFNYAAWFFRNYGFQVFGMFLLGLFFVKQKVVQELRMHIQIIRKVWKYSLCFSVFACILFCMVNAANVNESTVLGLVSFEFTKLGRTILCLFYASSIILIAQVVQWKQKLKNFAAVGRMALTNYLLQSAVLTTFFYSYGSRLYGKISPAIGLVVTFVFYIGQIILSTWWLRRYKYGPFEWVWRSLTYGVPQPMRISRNGQQLGRHS